MPSFFHKNSGQIFSIFLLTFFSLHALAEPAGDRIQKITLPESLEDQFGNKTALRNDTRIVIFSAQKDVNEMINEFLGSSGQEYMDRYKIVYIADIHKMPSIITRLFALPRLRDLPYKIFLIYEESIALPIPRKENMATVFRIENKIVTETRYAASAEDIRRIIEKEYSPRKSSP